MSKGKLIRGAGKGVLVHIKALCAVITLTAPSGAFAHDEEVTTAAGFKGRVVYWDSANSKLYVVHQDGVLPTSGTVTGGTSAASGTASASAAASWDMPYLKFAGLTESLNQTTSRSSQTITDFDSEPEDFADKISGAIESALSGTANLIVSDPGYQVAESCMNYNLEARIRRTRTSIDKTETQVREFQGSFNGFNETDSVGGVSQVAPSFDISERGPFAA